MPTTEEMAADWGWFHENPKPEDIAAYSEGDLVRVLMRIRDQRADLAVLAAEVEQELTGRRGRGKFVVEGLGEVSIAKSTSRTSWDSDGLTRVLVAHALDERKLDEETGEYEPAWEAVARVLSDCARPSWRVTPLRARGIQVDEFCHEDEGHLSVQLPPRAH